MDAVELTVQDHHTVEQLFTRFENAHDPAEQLYEAAQVIDLDGRCDMNKDELVQQIAGS